MRTELVDETPVDNFSHALGRTRRWFVSLTFALVGLLGVGTLAPAHAAASPSASDAAGSFAAKKKKATKASAPKTVKVAKNSFGKLQLTWSKGKRAKGYRIIVARDKKMKKVVLRTKYTTKRAQWISGKKIKEGVRYYVQVQSYASKSKPGKKSKAKAVRPLTKPVKKPENLVTVGTSQSSIRVTWKPAKDATGYTVKVRATKYGTPVWQKRVAGGTKSSMDVTGIPTDTLGHAFFVTVTADRYERTFRDSETPIASTTAPYAAGKPVATGIDVASYNVWVPRSESDWNDRGARIASLLKGRDIVGVQELTYGLQRNWKTPVRPIQDLADRTGLTYPITYDAKQNVVPCSINSVHILHSSRFLLERCGSEELAPNASRAKTTDTKARYLVWSQLWDTESHERVLVVNTHLSNGDSAADDALRATQVRDIVAHVNRVNTAKLPVIVMGDLNAFYGQTTTTPMDVLEGADYLATDLFATTVKNGEYASTVKNNKTAKTAYRVDHVFTSRDIRIDEFEVKLSSAPPSDHHPMFATLSILG